MDWITKTALNRRTVTVLAIVLVLAAGVFTYRTLPVELFPEIEFPLVTVTTFYPSANPESVARDVTAPIENVMSGLDGLEGVQSFSSENRSIILANFEFGTDMEKVEGNLNSSINGISFPDGVVEPIVGRINPDSFPVLQLSVTGERELVELQDILDSRIMPEISGVEGVFRVEVTGEVQQQAQIVVDPVRMSEKGVSLFQVSQALSENSVAFPGGAISDGGGQVLPIKTTSGYESLDDLRNLVVGFSQPAMAPAGSRPTGSMPSGPMPSAPPSPVTLGEIADVSLSSGTATSISRTNGKPSIGVSIVKEPDANTIDVTTAVLDALEGVGDLPAGVEVVTVSDQGPVIESQIETLEREAILGLILAVMVVFVFFLTLRPSAIVGALTSLRPTVVIALSIPLSIFTAVLLMSWQGLALNFMTLGGLAISVGRVVDDSIVVLENVYRNIEGGRERWRAALDATTEVGPAITASTLATIVVFAPLGFIPGLVGAFFFPFALTVSFALVASLLVALTAVPVLGAYLLRQGDLPEGVGEIEELPESDRARVSASAYWMQRIYTPILRWALGHKAITLVAALVITVGSVSLTAFIPVNLFESAGDRFANIDMSLPPGTPAEATLAELAKVEAEIAPYSAVYISTVGSPSASFGANVPGGFNQSNTFVQLSEDAPEDIIASLRDRLEGVEGRTINITEVSNGPPTAGLDISVTGNDYGDISSVTLDLMGELETLEGVENVTSNVSDARDEIVVNVDPARAASIGLSARQVAFQVNQFFVGQNVTRVQTDNGTVDVELSVDSSDVSNVESVESLAIAGPLGMTSLGEVAEVVVQPGPVTITRTDGLRSASITGSITSDDTQAVGIAIQEKIDALSLPPGVEVTSGGVFAQIAEGFQAIFLAMAVGVALVYLVMVASLGSLRNPFVIITSLPLAVIGAMFALFVTGRSLGLPAMMGFLMLIGIVVTNAVVLIALVEQLRQRRGMSVYDALIEGGRVRLRPILMTALTTSMALLPLATFVEDAGGIIGAELATVVIGGLVSSTALTLVVVPVVYFLMNESIPGLFNRIFRRQSDAPQPAQQGDFAEVSTS
ncbi:MAG: efflux RND transporter permease subunit [Dehalococcoidia bacterium]|nr:efflux RND transporter permease subunit [Dehalococcoidia bacterium]